MAKPEAPSRDGRRRRSDGERTRALILEHAAALATIEGLGGLSIARLADAVGMSKGGLFAHFGSKEDLQLATFEWARALFTSRVIEPTTAAPSAIERLRALTDGYLDYVCAETFPGGCFFASALAEVDMQPGPLRDQLVAFLDDWLSRLEHAIREAQADGSLDPTEDAPQLAFEIESALVLANAQFVLMRTPEPLLRARTAIDRRLATATPP